MIRVQPLAPGNPKGSLYYHVDGYVEWMRLRNYSERTVENQWRHLKGFIGWCEARSITFVHEVTKPLLERYRRYFILLSSGKRQTVNSA